LLKVCPADPARLDRRDPRLGLAQRLGACVPGLGAQGKVVIMRNSRAKDELCIGLSGISPCQSSFGTGTNLSHGCPEDSVPGAICTFFCRREFEADGTAACGQCNAVQSVLKVPGVVCRASAVGFRRDVVVVAYFSRVTFELNANLDQPRHPTPASQHFSARRTSISSCRHKLPEVFAWYFFCCFR
jgi:hypothetical protein